MKELDIKERWKDDCFIGGTSDDVEIELVRYLSDENGGGFLRKKVDSKFGKILNVLFLEVNKFRRVSTCRELFLYY